MPTHDDLDLDAGRQQILHLLRARVCQVMTEHVDEGRLSLTLPLDYRAGWAIAVLARMIGIPPQMRADWGSQPQVEAVGLALARFHEAGMLNRAAGVGPWEGCER